MNRQVGFFEITDHTTASDWERFIANLEDVLTEWKLIKQSQKDGKYQELPSGAISKGIWHEKHDTVKFGNVTFDMRYQYLSDYEKDSALAEDQTDQDKQTELIDEFHDAVNDESSDEESSEMSSLDDFEKLTKNTVSNNEERDHGRYELPERVPECLRDLIITTNDFASRAHCLVRWYNLRRFLILTPRGDTIISEDRVKLVLSSASIALSNVDSHIPLFLQIRNPRNNFYQGISEHLNIRAMYQMIFFKKAIKQYSYLSDLINMFREKTGCSLDDPISATIRLNYCLDFFELFVEPSQEFAGIEYDDQDDADTTRHIKSAKISNTKKIIPQDMRSGATFEQVQEVVEECLPHPYKILKFIHIAALWPPVSDKVITDSQVHSDLDPAEAPVWLIRCVTSDNCNMKIVHETQAIYNLLSAAVDYAYDKLDGDVTFDDCEDRDSMKAKCMRLSYELSTRPEVVLSEKQSDSMRKLVALLFYRAAEITAVEDDSLAQLAGRLKKRPSLSEIYRSFSKQNRPSVKEFIIRSQISRPFNAISTPALPQRMFCTICDEEFRLCGAFTELCN